MIVGLFVGAAAILLGIKGFTPKGLPFTKSRAITGTSAKVAGVICILFGLACIAASAYSLRATR